MKTNKKKIYLFTSITVLIILITTGIFIKMNNDKNDIFITKKLDVNTSIYKKINDKVSKLSDGKLQSGLTAN